MDPDWCHLLLSLKMEARKKPNICFLLCKKYVPMGVSQKQL